ncbi:hypothetical protein [Paracidovorax avenae]|uniref:hypothetical protein n=1 Tax=Paracidovorax avenae TaxID=80867 RepID=UPI0012603603|nr:hypothetical protein [Paracidovorax avenae]
MENTMLDYSSKYIRKTPFEIINKLFASVAMVGAGISCCLLAMVCVLVYGNSLVSDLAYARFAIKNYYVALIAFFSFYLTLRGLISRKTHVNPILFVSISIVLSIAIHWVYCSLVHANWVSDFQHMWNVAGQLAAKGSFIPNDIYEQRVLPVLLPLIYIFGNNPAIVPVSNSVLLIGIMLIGYCVMQKIHGHRCAQIFTVLWMAAAEPIFSVKIPTHDLWGLFIIACIFLSIIIFFLRTKKTIIFSVCIGVVSGFLCIGLDIQRELGGLVIVVWVASVSIYAVKHKADQPWLGKYRIQGVMLTTACVVFFSGSALLKNNHIIVNSESINYLNSLRLASLAPGFSPGTYAYANEFGNGLFKESSSEAQKETALSLLLSDFIVQPEIRISGIIYKTKLMAELGGQHYFYQNGMGSESPVLLQNIINYNRIISIIICILLLAKLNLALTKDDSISTIFSLSMLGGLIGALVMVGEAQSRYLFPFWFFSAIVIATQFRTPDGSNITRFNSKIYLRVGCLMIFVTIVSLWLLLSYFYNPAKGRVLSSFTLKIGNDLLPQNLPPVQLDKNSYSGRHTGVGKLGFTLISPVPTDHPVQISAAQDICIKEKTSIRFGYVMPYVNSQADGAFELSLSFSGNDIWSQKLPNNGRISNVIVRNIGAANTCGTLVFKLVSRDKIFDSSWVQASRTEIYFPRLVRY